jgi:hypothetical protein
MASRANSAHFLALIEGGKLENQVKLACERLGFPLSDLESKNYEDVASPGASKEVIQLRLRHWQTRRKQRMREIAHEIALERRGKEEKVEKKTDIKPAQLVRRVSLAHTLEVHQRACKNQVESLNRTISKLMEKEDRSARVKEELAALQTEHKLHLSQRNSKGYSILERRQALENARERAEIRRQRRELKGKSTPRSEVRTLESEQGTTCYTEPASTEDESLLIMRRLQERLEASQERYRDIETRRDLSFTVKKQHFKDTQTRFLSLERAREERTNRVAIDLIQQQFKAKSRRQAEIAALRHKAASYNKDLESKLQSRLQSRSSSPKRHNFSGERDWEKRLEARKLRNLAEKDVKEEREMLKKRDFEENRRRILRLEKLHKEEILSKHWRSPETCRAKAPVSLEKEEVEHLRKRDTLKTQLATGLTRLVRKYLAHQ